MTLTNRIFHGDIAMANYSICGIDCDICKFKVEQNCTGCKENPERIDNLRKL